MAEKFVEDETKRKQERDLEKYRKKAIELGATDAKKISANMVIIDERVVAKCIYPKCPGYGTNANCPPYAMKIDEVRKLLDNFHNCIFIRMEIPAEIITGKAAYQRRSLIKYRIKLTEITSIIESSAFYDGYHLAIGFGNGSCKQILCPKDECKVLMTGQSCTHRLRARSPMEAVGMDVYRMATRVGWDIYPIGINTLPTDIPFGSLFGIVLVN
ncbi:MAG: DUF2284 domain-containing protein [Dehalococcoidia bacterium]|nr:MAG: DUF2284 domain-containing protein [Dehalococcoidia bacterium]